MFYCSQATTKRMFIWFPAHSEVVFSRDKSCNNSHCWSSSDWKSVGQRNDPLSMSMPKHHIHMYCRYGIPIGHWTLIFPGRQCAEFISVLRSSVLSTSYSFIHGGRTLGILASLSAVLFCRNAHRPLRLCLLQYGALFGRMTCPAH